MATLFLDHATIALLGEGLERARVSVRRAARHTTKSESKGGMDANKALHEAEVEIDKALAALGAKP